jgi:hypothetical protein
LRQAPKHIHRARRRTAAPRRLPSNAPALYFS